MYAIKVPHSHRAVTTLLEDKLNIFNETTKSPRYTKSSCFVGGLS